MLTPELKGLRTLETRGGHGAHDIMLTSAGSLRIKQRAAWVIRSLTDNLLTLAPSKPSVYGDRESSSITRAAALARWRDRGRE